MAGGEESFPFADRLSFEEAQADWMAVLTTSSMAVVEVPAEKGSPDFDSEWADERPGRALEDAYYYVGAREADGHCVWLSPFWIDVPE